MYVSALGPRQVGPRAHFVFLKFFLFGPSQIARRLAAGVNLSCHTWFFFKVKSIPAHSRINPISDWEQVAAMGSTPLPLPSSSLFYPASSTSFPSSSKFQKLSSKRNQIQISTSAREKNEKEKEKERKEEVNRKIASKKAISVILRREATKAVIEKKRGGTNSKKLLPRTVLEALHERVTALRWESALQVPS